MILQRLYEHGTELDLPPIGYAPSPVHWLIDLDAEGNFEGFVGLPKGRTMEVPTLVRGSDIKPMLLTDNAEHVFGIARDGVVRAKANLRRWFDAQRRVGERLLSVRDLARTCYSDEDKMFSSVVIELMHAAVMRERLPAGLLAKVVARNRAERTVSYERAMLLELYFEYLRGGDMDKETIKTCGRLLAEYEGVRRAAGGDANGQSQYYSMVVNNPARGLAMVEKRTRPYFKRLRREKRGLANILEERIDSLTMAVGAEFPTNLTLEEQGLFALGYRQQRAEDAAEIKERMAAKEAKEQEEPATKVRRPSSVSRRSLALFVKNVLLSPTVLWCTPAFSASLRWVNPPALLSSCFSSYAASSIFLCVTERLTMERSQVAAKIL